MRKIKFTGEEFVNRLGDILNEFPHLDSLHPFYADLCNVLYDRDHYKLALGQLNICKSLISGITRDYTRLVKYGDSLYRCKQLKRAAMGRMATLMKKQNASLGYLEEVRKHLARLPSIDPSTRTLIVTGFPNVGKSSFMNKVTNANVEVQPYAFTTKSIFVGHTDYKYLRWQVLDTPGILDKPLEERNTIEMQAVTALAHLQCCVLYFVDLSETCGWSIEQQCSLFNNIRPLFANKPLIVIANKIDIMKWEDLSTEKRQLIEKTVSSSSATLIKMSSLTEEGVFEVKKTACELLLEKRVGTKVKSNKLTGVLHRITVTMPKKRDNKPREAFIPEGVLKDQEEKMRIQAEKENDEQSENEDDDDETLRPQREIANAALKDPNRKKTFKDLEIENGGSGTFSFELSAHHILKDPSWIHDKMPEILDGKNIADFVDEDILRRLDDLEREEEEQMRDLEKSGMEEEDDDEEIDYDENLDEEEKELVQKIREKKLKVKGDHKLEKQKNRTSVPRSKAKLDRGEVEESMREIGYDVDKMSTLRRGRSDSDQEQEERGRSRKRDRSESVAASLRSVSERKSRASRSRSIVSRAPSLSRNGEGLKNPVQKYHAIELMRKKRKLIQTQGRQGESDRFIGTSRPVHLNSGKRGMGKTDRR